MPGPKKAQRTKGNVKPSSSSQAAQLLAASGHAPTGFIGFSTQPAFVPVSETFDEAESALDGDFRLVLRKLSKRDTVTKIKALQEFSSLCTSKDEDIVKAVIPFWPRIYNKVAIDVDHKVRELSQRATASLASRTGKAMAPHLKSIMGMWVVSMCDTYPTVASAANQAFTSRFPGVKQAEAIRFSKSEIVECLSKNILSHSKQTLSDPQTTSDEDMEAKYHRVVTSSLQGLRKVLSMLPSDSVTDEMRSMLESSAFWKHGKSVVPSVKGGMLSLIGAVCQFCPAVSEKSISKIAPFVFSFLDCAEASIVSYAWEAVLSVVSAHENCWHHVNWQKAVWPKLKAVLENACSGQAAIVAPCLLPLLSKIPDVNFARYFESFRLGLIEDSVLNSPAELNAMVKSFLECMLYAVKSLNIEGKTTEIRYLLLDQMLAVIQGSLTEPRASLSRTELYASLHTLMSSVEIIDPPTEKCFWSDLSAFVVGRLQVEFELAQKLGQSDPSTRPELFERLKLLLNGLVFKESSANIRREKVKFSTVVGTEESPLTKPFNPAAGVRKKEKLSAIAEGFVGDILVVAFTMATVEEMVTPLFMYLFSQLVTIDVPDVAAARLKTRTDSLGIRVVEDLGLEPGLCITRNSGKDVVTALKSQLSSSTADGNGRGSSQRDFIIEHLIPVLFYAEGTQANETAHSAIAALFACLLYVEDDTALKILSSVFNSTSEQFVTCQLIEYTLKMSKQIPACKVLSAEDAFAEHIEKLALTATVIDGGTAAEASRKVWKMLTSVISSLDEVHNVSQPCLNAIMSSCVATLKQLNAGMDTLRLRSDQSKELQVYSAVLGLVQALLHNKKILTHPLLGEMVINLLSLLLQSQLAEKEESCGVEQLWLKGLGLILQNKSDLEIQSILSQMCHLIHGKVTQRSTAIDSLDGVQKVVKLLISSIMWNEDGEVKDVGDRMNTLGLDTEPEIKDVDFSAVSATTDNLLLKEAAWMENFHKYCAFLYVNGSLTEMRKKIPQVRTGAQMQTVIPQVRTGVQMQTVLMSSLYNLSVLELIMGLYQRANSGGKSSDTYFLSEVQISCLKCLFGVLIVLEAAEKVDSAQLNEMSIQVINLRAGLARCFKGLNVIQLDEMVAKINQESSRDTCPLEALGVTTLLEGLRRENGSSRKMLWEYEVILAKLKTSFIRRCQLSESIDAEVTKLLDVSEMSEDTVCKAFSLVFDDLMSSEREHYDIVILASCLSGFFGLAKSYAYLSNGGKGVLFQHLMVIINQLKDRNTHLVNSSDTMPVPEDSLELNVNMARALKDLTVASSDQYWEFTLCTVVEWIQFLSENQDNLCSDTHLQALALSVFKLILEAVVIFSTSSSPEDTSLEAAPAPLAVSTKAKTEWDEFFAEGVFSPLLPMFVSLATPDSRWENAFWSLIQAPLSSAVSLCPSWLVLTHQLPPHLTASDTSSLSDSLKTLLNHLCPLLMSRERSVAVSAYLIVKTVLGEIADQDSKSGDSVKGSKEEGEEEEMRSPPEAFVVQMEEAGRFLDCLKVVQVDDHIVMDQGTEERSQAMGYLLTWKLLLLLFKSSKGEVRAKYAQYFKSQSSVSRLLDHLFRLMPQYPDPSLLDSHTDLTVEVSNKDRLNAEVEILALEVYRGCLEILPALVRAWWKEQDRKSSNFVDRFTTQYLSTGLIWQQITSAQGKTDTEVEGITIKTRPAAREVLATYEMAEVTINMTITLPENFPLGKLEVSCDKRVGVSQAQWDRWLLQLNIFLQHQNGSIMEGLRLWKGNIDKKFEGLEDCMICFSVIHGTTLQLPRLTCRTCRKKFHSSCLYKWFSTSQKSSCPLCRNLF